MRLCLVSNEFAPFHGAGIGTYASLMAAAWAGAGHEVHVLTGPHDRVLEDGPRLRPGVTFHLVDVSGGPGLTGIGTWAERYALGVLSALKGLHAEHPFDYIEFPDYGGEGAYATWARQASGSFAGAVLGVRLHTPRVECRALNRETWLDEEGARAEALEDGAIRRADILISPSTSLLEMVERRLGGGPDWPRQAVVPYPFDRAAVAELLPDGGAPAPPADGPPTVLYFGRLERRKGVHLLVEAARRIVESGVDAHFRFIGGDTLTGPLGSSMRAHLEGLAGPALGSRIVFEAPRPRKELGEEVRRAAVVCVPSLWENFPNVVLESMSLGTPVVGSDAGGIGEIIRDGVDGLLFKTGDAADLERVLRATLAHQALRTSLGRAAPERIAGLCDPAAIVAQTLAVIENARSHVAASRRGGTPQPAPSAAISAIVVVADSDADLMETLAAVKSQGATLAECLVLMCGTAAPQGEELSTRVRATAAKAGCSFLAPGVAAAPSALLPKLRGEWLLTLGPGDVLETGGLERLLSAARRNPAAAFVTGLARWRDGGTGPAPVGLDRDLLASGVMPGPALVRCRALTGVGGWDETIATDGALAEWALACRLAGAGKDWVLVPEIIISRPAGRGAGPAPIAAVMHMTESCPALSVDPGRVMRILAARRGGPELSQTAPNDAGAAADAGIAPLPPGPRRVIHAETVYRQRFMEENLRYRIADRLSGALRATGIQRPLKAALRWTRGLARRLAGG